MTVRACSTYTARGGQVARIQEVMKHPGWSVRASPDFDVALGLLDRKIKFSDTCHSVDLPNHSMFPPFDDAWVAGWGCTRPDGIADPTEDISLQVYYAHVIPRQRCSVTTQRFGIKITSNFMCLEQKGRRAPCTRDTGAPAVSDGVLWGLASWGIRKKCGTERYPAVFSFVGSIGNLFFITNATRYLQTDPRIYPFLDRYRSGDYIPSPDDKKEKGPRIGPSILDIPEEKPIGTEKPLEIVKIPARKDNDEDDFEI